MSSVGSDDPCNDNFEDNDYGNNESYYDENYGENEDHGSYAEKCEYGGSYAFNNDFEDMMLQGVSLPHILLVII